MISSFYNIMINHKHFLSLNQYIGVIMKTKISNLIIFLILLNALIQAQSLQKAGDQIFTNDNYNFISVNEVYQWQGNNGSSSHDPLSDGSGFYWPGGEAATNSAIFADGLIWGGKINGQIYFNGSTYRSGLQAGKILDDGSPDDPSLLKYRIYKILKGWENLPPGERRDEYERDYNEWPVEDGAPWIDVNGDGVFTFGVDEPEFVGTENLWYVSNDLDSARTTFTYGSQPIGLEVQAATYSFSETNFLKDAVFRKYLLVNESNNNIDSLFIGYWSDDDLGFAGDDFSGCDSILNLGYTYNSDNFDENYYGENPPAIGHLLLQGTIVEAGQNDSAYFKCHWRKGFRNLPMTSFAFYIGSSAVYRDPDLGSYSGSIEFYNYLNGKLWDGSSFIDPHTQQAVKYPLAGNPGLGEGWYEGDGWQDGPAPGDRRILISSGPFTMAPGDTQEIAICIFAAMGSNNLNSISVLKNNAELISGFYIPGLINSVENTGSDFPTYYALSQNYPNPFNPITTIKYALSENGYVTLNVYNPLGELVAELVDKMQTIGQYEVGFNSDKLTSGVYIYTLKVNDFVLSKKMVVLK